jgi:L-seryl-tRNA(Ser) seleniumtransferase
MRLACLEATLRLYRDPARLADRLPTLRLLARPAAQIEAAARRLAPMVASIVGDAFVVEVSACRSQIGSGALPVETVESAGLAIRSTGKRRAGSALAALASALRRLPVPVIGRLERQALLLDLRCLEDEAGFAANLAALDLAECDPARRRPRVLRKPLEEAP